MYNKELLALTFHDIAMLEVRVLRTEIFSCSEKLWRKRGSEKLEQSADCPDFSGYLGKASDSHFHFLPDLVFRGNTAETLPMMRLCLTQDTIEVPCVFLFSLPNRLFYNNFLRLQCGILKQQNIIVDSVAELKK